MSGRQARALPVAVIGDPASDQLAGGAAAAFAADGAQIAQPIEAVERLEPGIGWRRPASIPAPDPGWSVRRGPRCPGRSGCPRSALPGQMSLLMAGPGAPATRRRQQQAVEPACEQRLDGARTRGAASTASRGRRIWRPQARGRSVPRSAGACVGRAPADSVMARSRGVAAVAGCCRHRRPGRRRRWPCRPPAHRRRRRSALARRLRIDAAIDFEVDGAPVAGGQLRRCAGAARGSCRAGAAMNFCPPKPGLTVITRTRSISSSTLSSRARRRRRIERHAGLLAERLDQLHRAVQMRPGFRMHGDDVGARLGEGRR